MDPLLKRDTEATHWELDRKESLKLLDLLFPDGRILQKRGALDKGTGSYTLPQVLGYLEARKLYGFPPIPEVQPPSGSGSRQRTLKRGTSADSGSKIPGGKGKASERLRAPLNVKKRWLDKSKCPDLRPEALTKREDFIARFLNTVLSSVKAATGLDVL